MRFLKKVSQSQSESNRRLKIVIIALAILCAAQGIFIYYHMVRTDYREHDGLDDFSTFIQKKLQGDEKKNWGHFDNFFDDEFFKKERDPFAEMENFHEKVKKMMEDTLGDSFDQSWNSWLDSRFSGVNHPIDVVQTETKKNYIITLVLENLQEDSLNIDIEADRISIKGTVTKILEKKDRDGQVLSRKESRQSISKILPVPDDADSQRADIVKRKNKIVITIPKK